MVGYREADPANEADPADAPAAVDTILDAPARPAVDAIAPRVTTARPAADALAPRVTHFLHRIRGLHSLSDAELEELLYERRFELLPTPAQPLPGIPGEGAQTLPTHDSIPSQQEMHQALLGDKLLPGSYQCVANVLYPESVDWPAHCKITGPDTAGDAEKEGGPQEGDGAALPPLSPAGPGSPAVQDQQLAGGVSLNMSLVEDSVGHEKSDGASGGEGSPKSPKKHIKKSTTMKTNSVLSRAESTLLPCEVTVCGLRIMHTLRGLPVPAPVPDEAKVPLYVDEAKYKAAREKKRRLEKALKLEGYRERRCCENIETLEQMKVAETAHLEEVRRRETRREGRMQVLKAQLEKDVVRKDSEDQAAMELDRQAKEKAAEAERKWKHHRKELKKLIEENASRTDEERQALRDAAREETRPTKEERQKSKKQMEAEDRAVRMRVSVEQRPPLPPRPHDLPAPAGSLDLGPAAQKARPPRFGSWVVQAKGVSDAYGLSPREHAGVEGQLMRAVKGSGRMAQYDIRSK